MPEPFVNPTMLNPRNAACRLSVHSSYRVEPLEPRVMLAVDFALEGVFALGHGLAFTQSNYHLFDFFRKAHAKVKFDKGMTEQINDEAGEAGEDDQTIQFDPSIITGPSAPTLAGTIEAIDFDTQSASSGFYDIPPDSSAAAGPNNLVNVVNTDIQWFTKAGALQNTQRLGKNSSTATGSFFAAQNPTTGTFDPKVVYDQYNGRFVVVALEQGSSLSRILIAVSHDSDPNNGWFTTAIDARQTISGKSTWMDYPSLAIDANAIYIAGNQFAFSNNTFKGSRLWIISKSGLYTGGAPTSKISYDPSSLAGIGENFSMQPTMMYGSAPGTTGTFLVSSGWTLGADDELSVIRVSNPLASPTFTNTFVDAGDINATNSTLAGVPQSGTTNTLDADDQRVYSAMWRNNTIWAANTVNPPSGVDANTPTAHWYKIAADSANIGSSPADQGDISGEDIATGARTFYPAITVDSSGNMGIGFSASGPNIFPGAYYTGRLAGDPAGTVEPAAALATGVDFYFREFGSNGGTSNRWGDYSGIAIDPSDNTTFWLYNEYALARGTVRQSDPTEDGRWGTRYGKFSFVQPVSATPSTPDLVTASDTGNSSTDDLTKLDNSTAASKLQFSIAGTVSGATVNMYSDGTLIGSAVASSATTTVTTNGSVDLTDGPHNITAKQTESGKTISLASSALAITVDTVAPTITNSSFQFDVAPQQLIYTFSEDVSATLTAGDLAVASVPAGTSPALAAPSWNAGTKTAAFNFSSSPVPNNNYTATMTGTGVTDAAGNPIAGNPQLPFFFLAGDGNRNKTVELTDFNILAANFGKSGQTFSQGNYDYSADGTVSITDFNVLAANFGKSLP
jgi:hypothetical protein